MIFAGLFLLLELFDLSAWTVQVWNAGVGREDKALELRLYFLSSRLFLRPA